MTAVEFHYNAADRLAYACRLLRKAVRQGSRVAVTAPGETLTRLDALLWSFDPIEFIPHVRLRAGESLPARLLPTPVWLVDAAEQAAHQPVLVNLGVEPPAGFESFARLIEVVSAQPDDRERARLRWKHYASRGYPIIRREVPE